MIDPRSRTQLIAAALAYAEDPANSDSDLANYLLALSDENRITLRKDPLIGWTYAPSPGETVHELAAEVDARIMRSPGFALNADGSINRALPAYYNEFFRRAQPTPYHGAADGLGVYTIDAANGTVEFYAISERTVESYKAAMTQIRSDLQILADDLTFNPKALEPFTHAIYRSMGHTYAVFTSAEDKAAATEALRAASRSRITPKMRDEALTALNTGVGRAQLGVSASAGPATIRAALEQLSYADFCALQSHLVEEVKAQKARAEALAWFSRVENVVDYICQRDGWRNTANFVDYKDGQTRPIFEAAPDPDLVRAAIVAMPRAQAEAGLAAFEAKMTAQSRDNPRELAYRYRNFGTIDQISGRSDEDGAERAFIADSGAAARAGARSEAQRIEAQHALRQADGFSARARDSRNFRPSADPQYDVDPAELGDGDAVKVVGLPADVNPAYLGKIGKIVGTYHTVRVASIPEGENDAYLNQTGSVGAWNDETFTVTFEGGLAPITWERAHFETTKREFAVDFSLFPYAVDERTIATGDPVRVATLQDDASRAYIGKSGIVTDATAATLTVAFQDNALEPITWNREHFIGTLAAVQWADEHFAGERVLSRFLGRARVPSDPKDRARDTNVKIAPPSVRQRSFLIAAMEVAGSMSEAYHLMGLAEAARKMKSADTPTNGLVRELAPHRARRHDLDPVTTDHASGTIKGKVREPRTSKDDRERKGRHGATFEKTEGFAPTLGILLNDGTYIAYERIAQLNLLPPEYKQYLDEGSYTVADLSRTVVDRSDIDDILSADIRYIYVEAKLDDRGRAILTMADPQQLAQYKTAQRDANRKLANDAANTPAYRASVALERVVNQAHDALSNIPNFVFQIAETVDPELLQRKDLPTREAQREQEKLRNGGFGEMAQDLDDMAALVENDTADDEHTRTVEDAAETDDAGVKAQRHAEQVELAENIQALRISAASGNVLINALNGVFAVGNGSTDAPLAPHTITFVAPKLVREERQYCGYVVASDSDFVGLLVGSPGYLVPMPTYKLGAPLRVGDFVAVTLHEGDRPADIQVFPDNYLPQLGQHLREWRARGEISTYEMRSMAQQALDSRQAHLVELAGDVPDVSEAAVAKIARSFALTRNWSARAQTLQSVLESYALGEYDAISTDDLETVRSAARRLSKTYPNDATVLRRFTKAIETSILQAAAREPLTEIANDGSGAVRCSFTIIASQSDLNTLRSNTAWTPNLPHDVVVGIDEDRKAWASLVLSEIDPQHHYAPFAVGDRIDAVVNFNDAGGYSIEPLRVTRSYEKFSRELGYNHNLSLSTFYDRYTEYALSQAYGGAKVRPYSAAELANSQKDLEIRVRTNDSVVLSAVDSMGVVRYKTIPTFVSRIELDNPDIADERKAYSDAVTSVLDRNPRTPYVGDAASTNVLASTQSDRDAKSVLPTAPDVLILPEVRELLASRNATISFDAQGNPSSMKGDRSRELHGQGQGKADADLVKDMILFADFQAPHTRGKQTIVNSIPSADEKQIVARHNMEAKISAKYQGARVHRLDPSAIVDTDTDLLVRFRHGRGDHKRLILIGELPNLEVGYLEIADPGYMPSESITGRDLVIASQSAVPIDERDELEPVTKVVVKHDYEQLVETKLSEIFGGAHVEKFDGLTLAGRDAAFSVTLRTQSEVILTRMLPSGTIAYLGIDNGAAQHLTGATLGDPTPVEIGGPKTQFVGRNGIIERNDHTGQTEFNGYPATGGIYALGAVSIDPNTLKLLQSKAARIEFDNQGDVKTIYPDLAYPQFTWQDLTVVSDFTNAHRRTNDRHPQAILDAASERAAFEQNYDRNPYRGFPSTTLPMEAIVIDPNPGDNNISLAIEEHSEDGPVYARYVNYPTDRDDVLIPKDLEAFQRVMVRFTMTGVTIEPVDEQTRALEAGRALEMDGAAQQQAAAV